MWYNYVNRATEQVRVWRRANLKFHQDDIGMMKHKNIGKLTDKIFRMARSQGSLRGSVLFLLAGIGMSLGYVKSNVYDPVYVHPKLEQQKRKQVQNDKQSMSKLFLNRVGAPSRPTRSIQDLMTFLGSTEAINKAVQFISYDGATQMSNDQEKGLDGIITQTDASMLKYYSESLKFKSSH